MGYNMNMNTPIQEKLNPTKDAKNNGKVILHWFEIALGVLTLVSVFVFTSRQAYELFFQDWSQMDTFLESLKIILQLAIGIEVARMLFSYSLNTLIELAVFIVIRKMLLLDGEFISLLIGVIALILLFAARHFFMSDDQKCRELDN